MAPRRRTQTSRSPAPLRDGTPALDPRVQAPDPIVERLILETLDPVLIPLGFAPAQVGLDQAIFCRGLINSTDGGCVDLVLDLDATPTWHIIGVRYWGFPSDRWQIEFDRDGSLADQLTGLARTLPAELSGGSAS